MVNTLTFSMAIDIQREEVLLPNDRRSITTKTNVNRTNKPSTNAGHLQVAPSFDHASSFGRELLDSRRSRLLREGRVGVYAEKGRGAVYWSEDERRGPSPLELTRRATRDYPNLFCPGLVKIERLDVKTINDQVDRVPTDWMSPTARDFAIELMRYNVEQLSEMFR